MTAGVIVTKEGAVVVDTLPFPRESKALATSPCGAVRGVRYVVDTHAHADHTHGSYLFGDAELISHRKTREFLIKFGEQSLTRRKRRPLSSLRSRCACLTWYSTAYSPYGWVARPSTRCGTLLATPGSDHGTGEGGQGPLRQRHDPARTLP